MEAAIAADLTEVAELAQVILLLAARYALQLSELLQKPGLSDSTSRSPKSKHKEAKRRGVWKESDVLPSLLVLNLLSGRVVLSLARPDCQKIQA